jgi:hypothetical protein
MGIADAVRKTGTIVRRGGIALGATATATHALQHLVLGAYATLNILDRHTHAHDHSHDHSHHHVHDHVHYHDPSTLQQLLSHPVVEASMIAMVPFLIWEAVHHYRTHKQLDHYANLNEQLRVENNSLRARNDSLARIVTSYGRE